MVNGPDGSGEEDRKWSGPGYILKVGPTSFAVGIGRRDESKGRSRIMSRFLTQSRGRRKFAFTEQDWKKSSLWREDVQVEDGDNESAMPTKHLSLYKSYIIKYNKHAVMYIL